MAPDVRCPGERTADLSENETTAEQDEAPRAGQEALHHPPGAPGAPYRHGPQSVQVPYAQWYQQTYHRPPPRPRTPLPRAPGWLPVAVLGVGVVAALLATLDRPGAGLVITGVVAGLTALAALRVGPTKPDTDAGGGATDTVRADGDGTGRPSAPDTSSTTSEDVDTARSDDDSPGPTDTSEGPPGADAEEVTGQAGKPVAPGGSTTEGVPTATTGESFQRDDAPSPERRSHAWSAVYGVLAASLLLTAVFRDAGWVLLWTLTASLLFASMAFAAYNPASPRGAVGVVTGSLALFRNLPSAPRFLLAPLRDTRSRRLAGPVLLTVSVTAGLLLVFGVLFASADAVFAGHLRQVFSNLFANSGGLTLLGDLFAMAVAVLLTGSAVLTARRRPAPKTAPSPSPTAAPSPRTPVPVWVWTVPLGALALLFGAFLGVQTVAMFGGDEYVQRVAGVTYAEYARQGFFQLVMVSLLVLCVIAAAVRILPSRATRTLRNALLGALCVLTLVILASAMLRLQLYIDTFGLTRLRISAEAWIVWCAGVFALVIAAGMLDTLGRPAPWLPRATAALAGLALAVFAYGDPDLRIAESHHDLDLSVVDTWYLRDLSTDALPGLLELEGRDRDCALVGFQDLATGEPDMGLASWNLSRHRAQRLSADLDLFAIGGQADVECSYRWPR